MRPRSLLSARFAEKDRDTLIRLGYDMLLGREVDPSGLLSQRAALTGYGDLPLLVRSLVTSPEGLAHAASAADLARYLDALGRISDAPALDRAILVTAARHLAGTGLDEDIGPVVAAAEPGPVPPLPLPPLPAGSEPETAPALTASWDESGGLAQLRVCAIGAAGQDLQVGRPGQEPLFMTRLQRSFEYHAVQGLPAGGQEGLVAGIGALGLTARLNARADVFAAALAQALGPDLREIADRAQMQPPPAPRTATGAGAAPGTPPEGTPEGTPEGGLIGAYLRALYARHHHAVTVDDAFCAHNRDRILAWYVTVWPDHAEAPGRLALTPAQVAHLRHEVLDADTLGHAVTRHILHFARRRRGLDTLLASAEGMETSYVDFLLSPSYRRLAHLDLVPPRVIARLAAPMQLQGVALNRFWCLVLARDLARDHAAAMAADPAATPAATPADLPARDLAARCGRHFAAALVNGLHAPLIPPEWFRMARAGDAAADWPDAAEEIAADPVWDSLSRQRLRDRRDAVLALLRRDPLEQVFAEGWRARLAAHEAAARAARPGAGRPQVTLVGHGGGSGLSTNLTMFRAALRAAGIGYRRLEAETLRLQESHAGSAAAPRLARDLNLLAVNADLFTLDVNQLPAGAGAGDGDGGRAAASVGFFLWETTRAPQGHRSALAFADEIWVPTEFVRSVYDDLSGGRARVVNIGKAITLPDTIPPYPLQALGIAPGDFVFLNISDFDSAITRKNPLPVVQAFRRAFPDRPDVRLILKIRKVDPAHWSNTDGYWTRVLDAIGDDGRISILSGDLPEADYWGLLRAADCFVSLHRAEGFGYGAAHAMAMGVPVIVTDFSGTRDFCTEATALLVPGELVAVARGDMPFREDLGHWAEADVGAAAAAMARVHAGGPAIEAMVQAGRRKIATDYAPDRFAATIRDRIVALCG